MDTMQKLLDTFAEQDLDYALLCLTDNVVYASGFDTPVPIYSLTYFAMGLPLSLVLLDVRGRRAALAVHDGLLNAARRQSWVEDLRVFSVFDFRVEKDPLAEYRACARSLLGDYLSLPSCRVGVEYSAFPLLLREVLFELAPEAKLVDVTETALRVRAVKTPRELALMEASAAIVDRAMETFVSTSQKAGMTELDLWSEVLRTANAACGRPAVVSGELVTGPRTALSNFPGGPNDRRTLPGDCGLMDFSVRQDGYWCDCCNVVCYEGENAVQRGYFEMTREAFERAVGAIRPGATCAEVYLAAEGAYLQRGKNCPHYIGHAIGAGVNDLPKVVPYDRTVLLPGMTFSLEPGYYSGNVGVRVEKMVVVTENGCRVLNRFRWGLE